MEKTTIVISLAVCFVCFCILIISALGAHMAAISELNNTIVKLIDDLNDYKDEHEK